MPLGGYLLDPYSGPISTDLACFQSLRTCVLLEAEIQCFDLAKQRLEDLVLDWKSKNVMRHFHMYWKTRKICTSLGIFHKTIPRVFQTSVVVLGEVTICNSSGGGDDILPAIVNNQDGMRSMQYNRDSGKFSRDSDISNPDQSRKCEHEVHCCTHIADCENCEPVRLAIHRCEYKHCVDIVGPDI